LQNEGSDVIPNQMTAIAISEWGGPGVLQPETRDVPRPEDGEVLVKVEAAGVNRPDALQRQGNYPPPKGASDIPGLEIAGSVVAAGSNVSRWRIGDRVVGLVPGGGYAEYCVVHETNALPMPDSLTAAQAAGVPETAFTVWHNLIQRGGLKSGEVALIHGATSGIGTTAIHIAKALGARVLVTAGSDEKCRAAEALGADHAINYSQRDFVEVTKEQTDGRGADVILDMVGGDYFARNYEVAAIDGRIVQIAFLRGPKAEVDFSRLMFKRLTHTGSTLRARSVAFKAELAGEVERNVWPLIADGSYRPVIDSTFPLERAAQAHERLEAGAHVGKIILEVTHGSAR
jgi:NADPH:quinone reductase